MRRHADRGRRRSKDVRRQAVQTRERLAKGQGAHADEALIIVARH
jgi:hypothetical protein